MGGGGMMGGSGGGQQKPSTSYLTINPRLKAVMDHVEGKQGALVSAAVDFEMLKFKWAEAGDFFKKISDNILLELFCNTVKILGVGVQIKDSAIATVAIESKNDDLGKGVRNVLKIAQKQLAQVVKIDFETDGGGAGGGMAGGGGGGMMGGGRGGGRGGGGEGGREGGGDRRGGGGRVRGGGEGSVGDGR